MNKYNIISDIAGRFDELQELLKLMPPAEKIILVGDLMDRGPKSKEVIEWAMQTSNVITLLGNHEMMMVEAAEGNPMDHLYNGGHATLSSYGASYPWDYPEAHINWMRKLPLCFKDDGLFVSHAPWLGKLEDDGKTGKQFLVWNRIPPHKVDGIFQVHGHNSRLEKYGKWGICIDACKDKVLTGITFPGKEIFQVPYKE